MPNLRKRRGEKLVDWQAVLRRIIEGDQRRSAADTRRAIAAHFERVKDKGITAERISLLCPISNKRVLEPARGVDCIHFDCFDLATFIKLQSSETPNWDCPFIACKKILSRRTVVIDEYIADVLGEVDDLVVKIELLPSGEWTPVEAQPDATDSLYNPDNGEDVQVVREKLATGNQREVTEKTVSVSLLQELRRNIGDVLRQLNGLDHEHLGSIATSLAEMNIFVKQQLAEAREPAASTRTADSGPSTSTKEAERREKAEHEAAQLRLQADTNQEKIESLETTIAKQTAQLESNAQALSKKDESFDALKSKEQAAAAENQNLERSLADARKEKAETERDLSAEQTAKKEVDEKLDEAQRRIEDLVRQLSDLPAQLNSAKEENAGLTQQIATLDKQISESQGAIRVYRDDTIPMLQKELEKLNGQYARSMRTQLQHARNVAANATTMLNSSASVTSTPQVASGTAHVQAKQEVIANQTSNGIAGGSTHDGDTTVQHAMQASTDLREQGPAVSPAQSGAAHTTLPVNPATPSGSRPALSAVTNSWNNAVANGPQGATPALEAVPPPMTVIGSGIPAPLQQQRHLAQMSLLNIYGHPWGRQFAAQQYMQMTPQQRTMAAQQRQLFHMAAAAPVFQGPPAVYLQPPPQQGPSNVVARTGVFQPSSSANGLAPTRQKRKLGTKDPNLPKHPRQD